MKIYWLTIIAFCSVYYYLIIRMSKRKQDYGIKDRIKWIKKRWVLIHTGALTFILVITLFFQKQLTQTVWCYYKGYEHAVETRHDWVSKVCSYKGPNNTWIPIARLIGTPEGDSGADKGNTNVQSDIQSR